MEKKLVNFAVSEFNRILPMVRENIFIKSELKELRKTISETEEELKEKQNILKQLNNVAMATLKVKDSFKAELQELITTTTKECDNLTSSIQELYDKDDVISDLWKFQANLFIAIINIACDVLDNLLLSWQNFAEDYIVECLYLLALVNFKDSGKGFIKVFSKNDDAIKSAIQKKFDDSQASTIISLLYGNNYESTYDYWNFEKFFNHC